jgi:hypothetical protein
VYVVADASVFIWGKRPDGELITTPAIVAELKDIRTKSLLHIFELRFNCRDGDQLSRWPFAPYEYRGIRYDIHMQRLLKVIVLGLFPDQNAIII